MGPDRRHERDEAEQAAEPDHAALAGERDLLPQLLLVERRWSAELEFDRAHLRLRAHAVERVLGRKRRRARQHRRASATSEPTRDQYARRALNRDAGGEAAAPEAGPEPSLQSVLQLESGPEIGPRRLLALTADLQRELEIEEEAGADVAARGQREPPSRLLPDLEHVEAQPLARGVGDRARSACRRRPARPRCRRRPPGARTADCPTRAGRSRCRTGCRPDSSRGRT